MQSNLEIDKILVEKSLFELNGSFSDDSSDDGNITVNYNINFMVNTVNPQVGLIRLSCSINENEFESSKFKLETSIVGKFSTTEPHIEKYFLNAATILFPYVRSHIATITSISGVDSVTLPPVNVVELLKKQSNNAE